MDLGVRGHGFLIVGGTAGMGLAAARALIAEGAHVAVAGRDRQRADGAAAALTAEAAGSGAAHPLVGDASQPGGADALVAEAVAALPDLAGVAVFTGLLGFHPADSADDAWEEAFQDVVLGTVRTVRAAVPHLVARGGGTIVTTAAYSVHSPSYRHAPYSSLKSAVATFTKTIAKEHGKDGIRANCLAPGVIETDALTEIRRQVSEGRGLPYDQALETLMASEWGMDVALARPGRPQEVGELAAFLLSERAGYLTGALVNIDGGTDF
jgi:3-oxoacyl-[acyl-carrier protein] reductase